MSMEKCRLEPELPVVALTVVVVVVGRVVCEFRQGLRRHRNRWSDCAKCRIRIRFEGFWGDECGSTSAWSWFIAGSRAQSVEQCGVDSCSLPGVDEGWTSLDKWADWCGTSVPGEVPSGEEEYILRGPN